MNRTVLIVLGIVVLVIVAGASFYGGMLYGQGQAQASGARAFVRNNGQGFPGGYGFNPGQGQGNRGQGGGVFGQVTQIGDGFMVVTDNNGVENKVLVTDTTLIEKNASVKLGDIATGEMVMVSGSKASDGTYTARSVQVAPAGRFGGPGGGPRPNDTNPGGTNSGTNP